MNVLPKSGHDASLRSRHAHKLPCFARRLSPLSSLSHFRPNSASMKSLEVPWTPKP